MAEQQMTSRTQSMTLGATHRHPAPSRAAQATRSLRLAQQQTGKARQDALAKHFAEYALPVATFCPLR